MAIVKHNNRLVKYEGKVFSGRNSLTFRFTGNQFPTTEAYGETLNAFYVDSIRFEFIKPTQVTIDYGDGTIIRELSYDYIGPYNSTKTEKNVFYISKNTAHTEILEKVPIHYYSDELGYNEFRTVKISYDSSSLKSITGTLLTNILEGPLNFKWSEHRNLTDFKWTTSIFTDLNVQGLSRYTNPNLRSLDFRLFSPTSVYYNSVPVELLNLNLHTVYLGNSAWNQSLIDGTTRLEELVNPNYSTRASLYNLVIYIPLTDETKELIPTEISELEYENLYLTLITPKFRSLPSVLNLMPSIRTIQLRSGSNFTNFGDISNLTNLFTFSIFRCHDVLDDLVFPSYFDNFTNFSVFSVQECYALRSITSTNRIIESVYDLITRNANIQDLVGTPYIGFTFNIRNSWDGNYHTLIDGDILPPSDFVEGVTNGTPTTSGEMLGVLVSSHYNMNLLYTPE